MPPRTRNRMRREQDYVTEAEMYVRGKTQFDIAKAVGISQQQVSYDLAEIRKRWLKQQIRNYDEIKARELAKIDAVEAQLWDAWERSKTAIQRTKAAKSNRGGDFTAIETFTSYGDPKYLDGVMRCIERRCALLGLDAPQEQTVNVNATGVAVLKFEDGAKLSDEERAARIIRILEEARNRLPAPQGEVIEGQAVTLPAREGVLNHEQEQGQHEAQAAHGSADGPDGGRPSPGGDR